MSKEVYSKRKEFALQEQISSFSSRPPFLDGVWRTNTYKAVTKVVSLWKKPLSGFKLTKCIYSPNLHWVQVHMWVKTWENLLITCNQHRLTPWCWSMQYNQNLSSLHEALMDLWLDYEISSHIKNNRLTSVFTSRSTQDTKIFLLWTSWW